MGLHHIEDAIPWDHVAECFLKVRSDGLQAGGEHKTP